MTRTLLAIDQGTTGSTALLLSDQLVTLGKANTEFRQIYPQPGWVEHDPMDILASVQASLATLWKSHKADNLAGIGITNQRETIVLWDRSTGKPLGNALVWQDRRTAELCATLREQARESVITKKTGLLLDPYFSATKAKVLLDTYDTNRARARKGELALGTIDSFLLWHFTGGAVHATDVSNASRTMLYNIHTGQWDPELLALFDVPREALPDVRPSIGVFGATRGFTGLPDGIAIGGIAGDQQSALFGQGCYNPGEAKCTYGTGAFLLMNTGAKPVASHCRLLTTIGWRDHHGAQSYAIEGSAFIAGAAVQWLRDGLKMIDKSADIEPLAASVSSSEGVVFVPALTGLGAPYWRPGATGMLHGITRGTSRGHIARAVLEGIAFQIVDLLRAMQTDSDAVLSVLRVDGGATANNLLMQTQADLLQVAVERPQMLETTALGAAMMAGLASGVFDSLADLRGAWKLDRRFEPQISAQQARERYNLWLANVEKA